MIFGSRSFDNKEKKQLIEQLPNLNQEEIGGAITVFKDEQVKWANMDKKSKKI